MATPQEWDSEITIVLAGKSGAGKSTLMKNLIGKDTKAIKMSPSSTTTKFDDAIVIKNNTKIHVIDTRGLAEERGDKIKELKRLSSFTDGKADILLFCVPVGPSSKFDDANPVTMRCLTEAYGKQIWDHCILVFTMCNIALAQFQKQNTDTATADYKKYLNNFAEKFEEQLNHSKVYKKVKTVLDMDSCDECDAIMAVPVGWFLDDEVLPGIDQVISEVRPDLASQLSLSNNATPGWRDVLFATITSKSPAEFQEFILQYRYGKRAKAILNMGAIGVVGGVIGGASRAIAGPPGVIAGIIIGIIAGASIYRAVVTGGTTADIGEAELLEKKKIDKEVYEIQHKSKK